MFLGVYQGGSKNWDIYQELKLFGVGTKQKTYENNFPQHSQNEARCSGLVVFKNPKYDGESFTAQWVLKYDYWYLLVTMC